MGGCGESCRRWFIPKEVGSEKLMGIWVFSLHFSQQLWRQNHSLGIFSFASGTCLRTDTMCAYSHFPRILRNWFVRFESVALHIIITKLSNYISRISLGWQLFPCRTSSIQRNWSLMLFNGSMYEVGTIYIPFTLNLYCSMDVLRSLIHSRKNSRVFACKSITFLWKGAWSHEWKKNPVFYSQYVFSIEIPW